MDNYTQAFAFIERCRAAGICHACGFSDGLHTHLCWSDAAVAQRGYRFATDLPGNHWHRMFATEIESAFTHAARRS